MAVISVNWSLASGAWYKLKGTSENDIMSSDGIYSYNDSDHYLLFYGYGGNDTITNSDSHDKSGIYGGAGDDSILNHSTDMTIDGGDGNDTIGSYGGKNSKIDGGAGDDSIENLWRGDDDTTGDKSTLTGGEGNDYIGSCGGKNVSIDGGDGNDSLINGWTTIASATGDLTIRRSVAVQAMIPFIITAETEFQSVVATAKIP